MFVEIIEFPLNNLPADLVLFAFAAAIGEDYRFRLICPGATALAGRFVVAVSAVTVVDSGCSARRSRIIRRTPASEDHRVRPMV
jgi:hypothetical protein